MSPTFREPQPSKEGRGSDGFRSRDRERHRRASNRNFPAKRRGASLARRRASDAKKSPISARVSGTADRGVNPRRSDLAAGTGRGRLGTRFATGPAGILTHPAYPALLSRAPPRRPGFFASPSCRRASRVCRKLGFSRNAQRPFPAVAAGRFRADPARPAVRDTGSNPPPAAGTSEVVRVVTFVRTTAEPAHGALLPAPRSTPAVT